MSLIYLKNFAEDVDCNTDQEYTHRQLPPAFFIVLPGVVDCVNHIYERAAKRPCGRPGALGFGRCGLKRQKLQAAGRRPIDQVKPTPSKS
jgi:hypothetical protein